MGLDPDGSARIFTGSSAATPFVSGTVALVMELLPDLDAVAIRHALLAPHEQRSLRTVVPPLLDAWGTYLRLASRSEAAYT
jgi:subtilisin family serine protease